MSQISSELHTFELIQCRSHPEFRVEAFCSKENVHPGLLCIKCLLDPAKAKEIQGDLTAIKDIITKSVEKKNYGAYGMGLSEISNENLEERVLQLSTKDHVGTFEKHVEVQIKKLDREIERLKDSLNDLRSQFVEYFKKQTEVLQVRDMDLKRKVYQFFQDKEELQNMEFATVPELLRKLRVIYDYEQYENFIRILHKKASVNEEGDGSIKSKLLGLIDEINTEAAKSKNLRVDTKIIEGNSYCSSLKLI